MSRHPPPDQPNRDRITEERERSVVVEASAGTGKTTLLTERVVSLVTGEGIPLENLAIVTFTEAAASELRVRIRAALPEGGTNFAAAWITTIHGFASRVLREYPHLTDGFPDFSVETSHFSRREQRMLWDDHLAGLSRADATACVPALSQPGSEALRELAVKLESMNWIRDASPFGDPEMELRKGRRELQAQLDTMAGLCVNRSDRLGTQMAAMADSLAEGLEFRKIPAVRRNCGSKENWGGKDALDEVKTSIESVNARLEELKGIEEYVPLAPAMERIVIPCALKARKLWDSYRTRLSYDDLLQRAHDSVVRSPGLRSALAARFRHILIDEFQDTSLLQANLFLGFLISCGLSGRLTIVGDPKQSIYGWRNADVETYKQTVDLVHRDGALKETISTSFRSSRSVIDFVNSFGQALFSDAPDEELPFLSEYSPLMPAPGAKQGPEPLVVRLPLPPDGNRAAEYKGKAQAEEAAEILSKEENFGDWAILFRSTTRLEELVEALDRRGIPYTVEAGRDFKERLEVQDTAMLIRAVTDPSDLYAWVHTLRSLYFGVDDAAITRALNGEPGTVIHQANLLLQKLRTAAATLSPGLFMETVFRTTCITEAVRASGYEVNRRLSNLRSVLERAGCCSAMDQLHDILTGSSSLSSDEPPVSPEGGHAVTLSTVHRAKGLTWTNVMVLNPGQGGRHEQNPLLTNQRERLAAVRLGEGRSPYFQRLSAREKARESAEFRRLLYVAVTRPRERLVIFSDAPGKKPGGHAGVLFQALEAARGTYSEKALEPLDMNALLPRRTDQVFRPSRSMVLLPLVNGEPEPGAVAMRLGTEVHALLEKMDMDSPSDWLERNMPVLREGMEFPDSAAKLALAFFETPLPFRLSEARVVGREYPLLHKGSLLYVDLLFDLGTHLEVIDFKTDSPSSLDENMQSYRTKLELYASTLEQVTGRSVACRLVLLHSRKCVSVREPASPETRGGGH